MTEKMMNKVMLECIRIARQNMDDDQYPIGAIITDDRGKIISIVVQLSRQKSKLFIMN